MLNSRETFSRDYKLDIREIAFIVNCWETIRPIVEIFEMNLCGTDLGRN